MFEVVPKISEIVKKVTILFGLAVLLLSNLAYAEKVDPLKNIYLELRLGMNFSQVRELAEKHYPECQLQDTDVWECAHDYSSPLAFSWVLGVDRKLVRVNQKTANLHRIVLRLDFNNSLHLINAVYVRANKSDFKRVKKGSTSFAMSIEERLIMQGSDNKYK